MFRSKVLKELHALVTYSYGNYKTVTGPIPEVIQTTANDYIGLYKGGILTGVIRHIPFFRTGDALRAGIDGIVVATLRDSLPTAVRTAVYGTIDDSNVVYKLAVSGKGNRCHCVVRDVISARPAIYLPSRGRRAGIYIPSLVGDEYITSTVKGSGEVVYRRGFCSKVRTPSEIIGKEEVISLVPARYIDRAIGTTWLTREDLNFLLHK